MSDTTLTDSGTEPEDRTGLATMIVERATTAPTTRSSTPSAIPTTPHRPVEHELAMWLFLGSECLLFVA